MSSLITNFIIINFITIIKIAKILLLLLCDCENIIIIIYCDYRRSTLSINELKFFLTFICVIDNITFFLISQFLYHYFHHF